MGWHDRLMGRLEPLLRGERVPPPADRSWLMLNGGTANFRAMAWGAEYLRITRFPKELPKWVAAKDAGTYIASWRSQCREFFETQKKDGFMCLGARIEQVCPDPHANFWITAVVAMRRAAQEAGHKDVLSLTSWWFQALLAVYKATMTPEGQPVSPGARAKGLPVSEVGMLVVQTLLRMPYPGVFKKPDGPWEETYYAGAREVRRLYREGDDLGGAAQAEALPRLRFPMVVQRFEGGHLAWCRQTEDEFPLQSEFADWVLVRYVKFRRHDIELDRNWQRPRPEIRERIERQIASPGARGPRPRKDGGPDQAS